MLPRDSAVISVKLGGIEAPRPEHKHDLLGGWLLYQMVAPGAELPVEVTLHYVGRHDFWVWEADERLPAGGEALVNARPARCVPYSVGDRATWWRHIRL